MQNTDAEEVEYQVYADGSFDASSQGGGWAFLVHAKGQEVYREHGIAKGKSNNSLELLAVLKAVIWIKSELLSHRVTTFVDSIYVIEGIHRWLPIWRNNGWRRIDPNPRNRKRKVADVQLWQTLNTQLAENTLLRVVWCKGHEGIEGNDQADRLANAARITWLRDFRSQSNPSGRFTG